MNKEKQMHFVLRFRGSGDSAIFEPYSYIYTDDVPKRRSHILLYLLNRVEHKLNIWYTFISNQMLCLV